ncbi:MAG: hypothetical protein Q4E22_01120 [Coriobacteriia bacterium]|nr:hypothetical protein [Coriobacteriia bacterium]
MKHNLVFKIFEFVYAILLIAGVLALVNLSNDVAAFVRYFSYTIACALTLATIFYAQKLFGVSETGELQTISLNKVEKLLKFLTGAYLIYFVLIIIELFCLQAFFPSFSYDLHYNFFLFDFFIPADSNVFKPLGASQVNLQMELTPVAFLCIAWWIRNSYKKTYK